jgi:hypothetical protein
MRWGDSQNEKKRFYDSERRRRDVAGLVMIVTEERAALFVEEMIGWE